MPRTVQFTVPPDRTGDLVAELRRLEPFGLQLHPGVSLHPVGDVVSLEVSNAQLADVMQIADRYGLGEEGGIGMATSVPLSVVGAGFAQLAREPGNTTWEELELAMGQESTMSLDKVAVMFIAGLVAGAGLVSGAIHVVVGAMIIAPGFQPFARATLGLVNRSATWRGGSLDIVRGYGALLLGAAVAGIASMVFGGTGVDDGNGGSYLQADALVRYWSTTTWSGVAVGIAAAVAGGLLMAINRTVLTAGVMVALALVPTAALVPLALLAGDLGLAASSGLRFLVEVLLVLVGTAGVFLAKLRRDRRVETD